MSRNPQFEAIFEARYAWENSGGIERESRLTEYHRMLEEALLRAGASVAAREELEDSLTEPYREFRRAKRLEESAKLSRLR